MCSATLQNTPKSSKNKVLTCRFGQNDGLEPGPEADALLAELAGKLLPTLRERSADSRSETAALGERLARECRSLLSAVLPFTDSEMSFLYLLLDDGVVDASILTPDEKLQQRIRNQPLLEWKAINVRKHRGLS